jgi:hypothetical protein
MISDTIFLFIDIYLLVLDFYCLVDISVLPEDLGLVPG